MPMLSFLARFVPPVESGTKRQTIRLARKRPIKMGDRLIIATGARTANYRLLFGKPGDFWQSPPICRGAIPFHIVDSPYVCDGYLGGREMALDQGNALARQDGFAGSDELEPWLEMKRFLAQHYGLPFRGVVIRW